MPTDSENFFWVLIGNEFFYFSGQIFYNNFMIFTLIAFIFVAAVLHHRPPVKDSSFMTYSEFSIDSVCKKGSTLLWDLVQEDTCVRLLKTVFELTSVLVNLS